MNSLSCPHCNGDVLNDPRLAGQVVACPNCNKPFRMPRGAGAADSSPSSSAPSSSAGHSIEFAEPDASAASKSGARRTTPKRKEAPAFMDAEPWYYTLLSRSVLIVMGVGLFEALFALVLLVIWVIDLMQVDVMFGLQWLSVGLIGITLFLIFILCGVPLVLVVMDIARNTRGGNAR